MADLRITQVGDSFIVDLPSPEIFKATLDENSVRVTRDATFLMRLSDLDAAAKQNDIRIQMLEAGKAFAKDRGLLPTRNENIRRIREMLSVSSVDTSHLLFTVPNS